MVKSNCLFCKIVKGEIPSKKVYEDDFVLAFHDIKPKAPIHVLVIPKKHIESLAKATKKDEEILGKLNVDIAKIAKKLNTQNAFRVQVFSGKKAGQEIDHLHYHILGGR